MKLSQKLLGLAGLAVADYACCPYDDYGIRATSCDLTEKTPFNEDGLGDWNNNMCKAWESNVDATYEGNDKCGWRDWGSCGFQRHFAWDVSDGIGAYANVQKVSVDTNADGSYDTDKNVGTGADQYTVGGKPFLGGICKLFIPVAKDYITQVSVSGVHVSGASQSQYPAQITVQNSSGTDETVTGTAYCFSVVNIAEFKTNTNGVGNGNVAGAQPGVLAPGGNYDGSNDIFLNPLATSLQRQAGIDIGNFGDTVSAQSTTAQGEMVEGGANFDVVAHFNYQICQGLSGSKNWNTVDMQMAGDVNSGSPLDYPLDPTATDFSHAHTDLQDKRHDRASLVSDGLYAVDGGNAGYLANSLRWPNFGAWAGFNSVVICANNVATISNPQWLHQGTARTVAMSVGSNGFRSQISGSVTCATDLWAEYQFNIRQIGTGVVVCGPGQLPDTDNSRCTWNWNYDSSTAFGPGASTDSDPEGFFDRNDNMAVAVWARKRRAAVSRTEAVGTQPVNAAAQLSTDEFTFTFKDQDDTAIPTANIAITELSDDNNVATGNIRVAANVVTVQCTNTYTSPGTNQRDLFPSCFTGDEVHLKVNYRPNDYDQDNRGFLSPWFSLVSPNFSA